MKKPAQPQPVQRWLQKTHPAIAELVDGLEQRAALLGEIKACLPQDLAPHCVGAEIQNKQLKLFASSSVWATRLRYSQDTLLTLVKNSIDKTVSTVQIRVITQSRTRKPEPSNPTTPLSQSSSELIKQTAQHLDAPLRDALNRLASHKRE